MEQHRRARPHGVLVIAESRQRHAEEMPEGGLGVGPRDGEPERLDLAEMRPEPSGDEVDHRPRPDVGGKAQRLRHRHVGRQPLAVLRVEVPCAALGLPVGGHQQTGPPPHVAIEMFHAQLPPAARPASEPVARAEEAMVRTDLDRHAEQARPCRHVRLDAPLAGFGDDDAVRAMACDRPDHLAAEAAAVPVILQLDVVDPQPGLAQGRRVMAHGREQEHDLLRMMPDVGRLVRDFHHQHHVLRTGAVERAQAGIELVAEDDAQRAHEPPANRDGDVCSV